MRSKPSFWMACLSAAFLLSFALPAAADITVLAHYTLVNGDTLSRASYYTPHRVRVTGPDGKEFIYDSKTGRVTIISHPKKIYWEGPLGKADSIADRMLLEGRRQVAQVAARDQAAFMQKMQDFNDSIRVTKTESTRHISGYPCTQWLLTARPYIENERWVARGLSVANYGPEIEKVVMASIMDPVGRGLMKLLIRTRASDGLPLVSKTTFNTLTQKGSFGFEAYRVISQPIASTVWEIPKGYQPIELK